MADESTFLQMLAEHPDDLESRLVYADWLEGVGETQRARLLRLHDELVRTPFDDDASLVRKSRALLMASRKLDAAWLAAVSYPRLEGTCWGTRDHEGVPYLVAFRTAGLLHYRRVKERVTGTWGQVGTAVRFDINSYSEHSGVFVGSRMRGVARNQSNGTWNWELARIDDRYFDGDDFPELPPEPMDTNYREGDARDGAGR